MVASGPEAANKLAPASLLDHRRAMLDRIPASDMHPRRPKQQRIQAKPRKPRGTMKPKCFSSQYLSGLEPEVIRAAKKIRRHLNQNTG